MIKFIPADAQAKFDEIYRRNVRIFTTAGAWENDARKLSAMRGAGMFMRNEGVADNKLGDMPAVLVAVPKAKNMVVARSPQGWVDVSEATALELAQAALGIIPEPTDDKPTARQIFNPTGDLVGDLLMATLAGLGQALTAGARERQRGTTNP